MSKQERRPPVTPKPTQAKSVFTPGPWQQRSDTIGHEKEDGSFCALAYVTGHAKDMANAQLICSAPAMRSALEACVRAMTVAQEDGGEAWNDALEAARAAIDSTGGAE